MHLNILALDLDGTLAEKGLVSAATWEALRLAKKEGLKLILVTGRRLEVLSEIGPFDDLFEAIIAENGAAVYFPRNDKVILPFGHLASEVVEQLEAADMPLERGMAIAATWVPHDKTVLEILAGTAYAATVEYNKGAVMILPPGATKGTGLLIALKELGYSAKNMLACGDAENDRSMFTLAEMAVAVANATPPIKSLADTVLSIPNGRGIQQLIQQLIQGKIPKHKSRLNKRITLGKQMGGQALHLSPFSIIDQNICIAGESGSGKSWLAGFLMERLLQLNYQLVIIDPEGDYSGLRAFPHTLLLGGEENTLPAVADVITICEYAEVSLILDLSVMNRTQQIAYLHDLLLALFALRERRGKPHWFLLDEAHYFCGPEDGPLTELLLKNMVHGGVGLVSYRPSFICPKVLAQIDHWFLTRMSQEEEIEVLKRTQCKAKQYLPEIRQLASKQVYLCLGETSQIDAPLPGIIEFETVRRVVPHVRHLHKYLMAPLPKPKRFYYKLPSHYKGAKIAASLWEFRETIPALPIETIQYHLKNKDFERWLKEVMHDQELARQIRKLSNRRLTGAELRDSLYATVTNRFEELESLV